MKLFLQFVPGLLGALAASVLGFYLTSKMLEQRFYPLVLPGALAGLACGFFSVTASNIRGVLAGLIALFAGLITQWKLFQRMVPTDGSFLDFLAHIQTETKWMLALIGVGGLIGFWWGREATFPWRNRFVKPR